MLILASFPGPAQLFITCSTVLQVTKCWAGPGDEATSSPLYISVLMRLLPLQESEAMSYVAGYTVAHDVSARDWQMHKNGGQWLKLLKLSAPWDPPLSPRLQFLVCSYIVSSTEPLSQIDGGQMGP